jgi:hypothetical protein
VSNTQPLKDNAKSKRIFSQKDLGWPFSSATRNLRLTLDGGWRQLGNGPNDVLDTLEIGRHAGAPMQGVALTWVNGAASCRKKLAESYESPGPFSAMPA